MPKRKEENRCWRGYGGPRFCGAAWGGHDQETGACPNGHGSYQGHSSACSRVGNTFSLAEVEALEELMSGLLQWRLVDGDMLRWLRARSLALSSLRYRVRRMATRAANLRATRGAMLKRAS